MIFFSLLTVSFEYFYLQNGLTPLHLCAQEDKVNVATVLGQHNAEIDAVTKVIQMFLSVCNNDFIKPSRDVIFNIILAFASLTESPNPSYISLFDLNPHLSCTMLTS